MASAWTPSAARGAPAHQREPALTHRAPARYGPIAKRLPHYLAVAGMICLAYFLGAAVLYFQLPTSDFLGKAFLGARAWNERQQLPSPVPIEDTPRPTLGPIQKLDFASDGFTLYACASMSVSSTQAFLVNLRGEEVHRWAIPFSRIWPSPPHVRGPINDALVGFFDCRLFPNGDLLVVLHGQENRANGYGLVKLDKNSQVIWKYARQIHHDVDVGEDGTIYAISQTKVSDMPSDLEFVPTPALVDELVQLSAEGKELSKPISILKAFRDSPYASLMDGLGKENRPGVYPRLERRRFLDDVSNTLYEPLHTNCVRVLPRQLAAKFPNFQAGQLLISMRHLNVIAILDPRRKVVTWAARGPWHAQHDAQFLNNGHLLIFDNLGSARGSRVLEYDPLTQALPWSYPRPNDPPFLTHERGMCQRLPNGNTLIVSSEQGAIWEVTPSREMVWSLLTNQFVNTARRYSPEQLPFLVRDTHARR